jgi:glycosyltransferase involved in cell wall biosynthesis
MMPKVSVIIPNYNHGRFLGQRIQSVLDQSYGDFDIHILDDGSTDESVDVIAQYASDPRIATINYNERNSAFPFRQWQRGASLAAGEMLWVAESDDWADKRFLETMVPYLEKEGCVLAYCRSHRARDGQVLPPQEYPSMFGPGRWEADFIEDGVDALEQYLAYFNAIPNASAVLFRRRSFLEIRSYPEHMQFAGDWLIWGQIAATGKIGFCHDILNYYRFHMDCSRCRQPLSNREWQRYSEIFTVLKTLQRKLGRNQIDIDPRLYWVVRGLFATPIGRRFFSRDMFHQTLNADDYVVFGQGAYVEDLIGEMEQLGWQKPALVIDTTPGQADICGVPLHDIRELRKADMALPVVLGTNMFVEEAKQRLYRCHPLRDQVRIVSLEKAFFETFTGQITKLLNRSHGRLPIGS